jgi:hypothetical protein
VSDHPTSVGAAAAPIGSPVRAKKQEGVFCLAATELGGSWRVMDDLGTPVAIRDRSPDVMPDHASPVAIYDRSRHVVPDQARPVAIDDRSRPVACDLATSVRAAPRWMA